MSPILSLGIFQDAQGQLIQPYVIGSGRILNSVETLWLSLLPARIRKIRSKKARVATRFAPL